MTFVEKALQRVNKLIEQAEEGSEEQIDYIVLKQSCEKQLKEKPIYVPKEWPNGKKYIAKICPKCGEELFENQSYCDECGQKINQEED